LAFPYPIHTMILTNRTNRSFEKREETRFLVIHETVSNADARMQYAYINTHDGMGANAHCLIDWNEVLQILPFDEVSWSVGQPANQFTFNLELCHADNRVDFDKQWEIATGYAAQWCRDLKRDPYVLIRSHHEIAIEFGGTDHTDPDDYFARYGKSINQFRADVYARLRASSGALNQEGARKVIDLLAALYQATNDKAVRDAAHYAADALRDAAGLAKQLETPARTTP
jgi:N-acetylmuramoyl-L-alanine amidase CwlA